MVEMAMDVLTPTPGQRTCPPPMPLRSGRLELLPSEHVMETTSQAAAIPHPRQRAGAQTR